MVAAGRDKVMMTGRERLNAIFQNEPADRPALKLWGFYPDQQLIDNAYREVYELAAQVSDYMCGCASPANIRLGTAAGRIVETRRAPGPTPQWEDITTIWHTPAGDLTGVYRASTSGLPGYDMEHLVKTPQDLEALLSVPYEPLPFSLDAYHALDKRIGDRGICVYEIDEAMYALQALTGPENFALMSIECRDLMHTVIAEYSRRIRLEVQRVFDAGLKPVFGWVGPEVCIPPLMSPRDFEDFVMGYDKPLCDDIHERGGQVWVHCHNHVARFIERFIHMGVDVLNPIEPPPMGDVILPDAVERFGNRIGFEGNIETHDLWTADAEHIEALVTAAVAQGGKSGRFILCPSAGYMEFTRPTQTYIDNLLTYLRCGYEQVCAHSAYSR